MGGFSELRAVLCGVGLALLASSPIASQDRPTVTALQIGQPVRVDGELTDSAWLEAEWAGDFTQRDPSPGAPSTETTEFAVAYTPDTLFVAVRANDREPERIVAKEMERDSDLFQDDSILLMLDTFHDLRNGYVLVTNPNGARGDALITDEGRDVNWAWDGVWRVSARRAAAGWVAEIAIPVSTLRFDPQVEKWGLNVQRVIR
ncbi:MAG: carbohydrate binding family 9 domain-containing protein, partial [Holophagales bacterium]|nr:carbohydrate binding family 9 domain-containing protein [Holophagales bacterium]